MVYISLRSRADMKKHLDELIELSESNKFLEACNKADSLKIDIIKHFSTRGIDCKNQINIIMQMKYTLTHYTVAEWRKKKMHELTIMLINALSSDEKDETLRGKISRIYQDVVEDLNTICLTGDPKDIDTLSDDFLALQRIAEQVSELKDPDIYEKYTLMMGNVGQCQATLNKLNPRKAGAGEMWTLNKDALGSLSTSFQILYASIEKLIAGLSEPPESKEHVKKEPSESFSDLEEEQLAVLKAQAMSLLKDENWSLGNIAPHMNMTLDELIELLGIDEEE